MRISTQQLYTRGLDSMLDVNSQLQKTQLQISTGKRVLTPADDPVASTRILQLNQELELNGQFQRNIELADNRLKQQDDLLGNIDDVLQRVRELATQAGDGALNADDKKFIANELRQRLDQLAGMMNSKDPSGEFLFGGFQGKNQPFVKNVSGAYVYAGDEGQRYIQIDSTVTVATSENGKGLFVDVQSAKNTFFTSANPLNTAQPPAAITSGMTIDQDAFDKIYPDDLVITMNPFTNVVPSGPNYTVTLASSGKPLLSNQPFQSGQPISVAGIQFEITGQPQVGDTFFVDSSPKQGLLTTVEKLIYGLEHFQPDATGQQAITNLIDDTISNVKNAETSILDTRSRLGARMNTIDSTKQLHQDVESLSQEVLSGLQDLDYAEAVSRLSLQSFVLQASQQTYSRVTSLTLFDQIR